MVVGQVLFSLLRNFAGHFLFDPVVLFQYQAFHMVEYIHADRGEGDRFPT
jgi:hypothetical protein